ncbi:MAG: glycosyltransferase family 39 protein [Anaerolineae bacterium]|nr:glycosyltransferase family 39 protein [Anaerolineae bacterium]
MWRRWVMVAILLLAFGLRLYRLGAESLWYDETVSVHLAAKSLPALIAHTAGDIHPPGYYVLLHVWIRLAGRSDFAAAFPSLFFGVLLVALAYRLAVRFFGPEAGLLAAFLVTVSPYNLWYSQEVRMYTLAATLGMCLLEAILPLLAARPAILPSWHRLAAYAVCAALGLWVLYYFAFLLAAVNLVVFAWWLINARRHGGDAGALGGRWLVRWLLAQAVALLLYAPWLPVAWRQATQPPVPPWRSFTALGDLLVQTWSALGLGQSAQPTAVWAWPVLLLLAILFGLGLFYRPRQAGRASWAGVPWFLAGYVFAPVLLIGLASLITPLYHVRYGFTYSTPFYIILGAGLVAAGRRWRPALWLGLAAVVVAAGLSIHAYHTDPRYASDDHRAAARLIEERWRPGDAILVNAGYAYTALLTYWDGDPIAWRGRLVGGLGNDWVGAGRQGPVVVQAGMVDGDPGLGWGDPASDFYAMTQAQTEDALTRLFSQFDRVWVYRVYDTVTDPGGSIRNWLDAHGRKFEDQVLTGESQLRVQGYLTGRDPLADAGLIDMPDAALADGSLGLVAAAMPVREVAVGEAFDLALVWRVQAAPAAGAILFAGLFDADGQRWAQADDRPLGSLMLPSAWPAGGLVRAPLRLHVPPGTPPGRYRLEVGWYQFVDGQPDWLPWTAGERLLLGEVTVAAPEDWQALPLPAMDYAGGVTIGRGLELVGWSAPSFAGRPGDSLPLDLFWRVLGEAPEVGMAVLRLSDNAGHVFAEEAPDGRISLAAGQVIRDPRSVDLPASLAPGVYNLVLGCRSPDGSWLPVRRGLVGLGLAYPLATVRVVGRSPDMSPPTVQYPADARFGAYIRLVGYDLPGGGAPTSLSGGLQVTLYWQALAPTPGRYKLFVHLVNPGNPFDIRAQADLYPSLPTTAWTPGEYLCDDMTLKLPPGLIPGRYDLLVGFYDEATGDRLPLFDAAGQPLGDTLLLRQVTFEQ